MKTHLKKKDPLVTKFYSFSTSEKYRIVFHVLMMESTISASSFPWCSKGCPKFLKTFFFILTRIVKIMDTACALECLRYSLLFFCWARLETKEITKFSWGDWRKVRFGGMYVRVSEELINRQEYNFPPDDIFSLFCPGVKQKLPNCESRASLKQLFGLSHVTAALNKVDHFHFLLLVCKEQLFLVPAEIQHNTWLSLQN